MTTARAAAANPPEERVLAGFPRPTFTPGHGRPWRPR